MYSHRSSTGPVDLAFTDRYGGVSAVPFDSLNLALVGGRRPGGPAAQRGPPARRLRARRRAGRHGAGARPPGGRRRGEPRERCDALVTDRPDVVLMVRVADCVPVLLADERRRCHRRGPRRAATAWPRAWSPPPWSGCAALGAHELTAWVGPHVCGSCYEVPAELRDEVAAVEPATAATTRWGTPALDLGAGVVAQLEREGVRVVLDADAVHAGGAGPVLPPPRRRRRGTTGRPDQEAYP